MSQNILCYRLTENSAARDRVLLHRVYEELAARQPSWLRCESFQLNDDQRVCLFVIDGAQERTPELANLAEYLRSLPERCEGEPTTAGLTRLAIDHVRATKTAHWEPRDGTWTLPGEVPGTSGLTGPLTGVQTARSATA